MNAKKEVPVLLLTGYLGSGKTTLLNKILANEKGIKFAVIVNDIGEVNIDAALIEKGGVVGQKDDSLVSLQNGCICCTLKMDLVEQLKEIVDMKRFDYIVIEASGICEPAPIAQTICSIPSLGPQYIENGILRLDSIVTVVDALRMKDEFSNGSDLMKKDIDEEDLASLVIQQIEFCNIILLNKAAEVEPKELEHLKQIIRAIQPKAEIFECNYGDVDLNLIVNTKKFDWETVSTSAGWIQEIESERNGEHEEDDEDEDEEHEHHHDHEHEGEALEHGISTFVWQTRKPLDLKKFTNLLNNYPNVIRTKGYVWFDNQPDSAYLFEQAGKLNSLTEDSLWIASAPKQDQIDLLKANPQLAKNWDEEYGDRINQLVFIGKNMNEEQIKRQFNDCLA